MANSKRLRVYRIWPGGEVELIKTFANIFRLFSRVKGEDYLKTIPSSQEFRTILEQERARADRLGYQFSLLIFLLGNWEDRLAIADHLTRALKKRMRVSDKVGWWDENEIGVILTGTSDGGAGRFADDIRQMVSASALNLGLRIYTYPTHWLFEEERDGEVLKSEGVERFFVPRLFLSKRCMDITGAIIALIFFAPLMLVIGVAIKLTSPGPILFRQERIGLLGMKFTFFKFRSMYVNTKADSHKDYVEKFITKGLPYEGADPVYKIKKHPGVTPLGRFLRKTSLDELPQLINVLKGEMSLVGPRPPIHYECKYYDRWHKRRVLDVKPGITGLWQVKGRSLTTFAGMVRLDLKYMREWSLWLDIKILLQTLFAVFSGKGAY